MSPIAAAADLLAPPRCVACGVRGRQPWCARCSEEVARRRVRRACLSCGAGDGGRHPCWRDPAPVDSTVVALRYGGAVAAAVVAGKVRGAWRVWPPLGRGLATVVAGTGLTCDVVTWVPADRARVRERGFDHAELLAAPVARALGVRPRALVRARSGRPDQASLADAVRRELSDDAFAAATPLDGARVLLVDDVLTTGATARMTATALRRAGASAVHLAVLARAGAHPLG